jgi:hypothetical protein
MITVCRKLLSEQFDGPPRARTDDRALTLTAGLIYFTNSTQNRPASGRAEHALLCSLLPVTHNRSHPDLISGRDGNPWANQDEEESDTFGPIVSTGMFHMRALRLSDESIIPRMETIDERSQPHPKLARSLYPQFFGLTYRQILSMYGNDNYVARPIARPVRSRGPAPWASVQSLQASRVVPPEFTKDQMDRFLGNQFTALSDNEEFEDGQDGEDEIDLPKQFSAIWGSFALQVLSVLPAPRGQHSLKVYHQSQNASLSDVEEGDGDQDPPARNEDWFRHMKSNELGGPDGFVRCSLRTASMDSWNRGFDYLFPGKNQIDPASPSHNPQLLLFNITAQGYRQAPYHTNWITLMKDSTLQDAQFIRQQARSRFNLLRWAPSANKAKMWETRHDPAKNIVVLPHRDTNIKEPCPRICLNPRYAHLLTWEGEAINVGTSLQVSRR